MVTLLNKDKMLPIISKKIIFESISLFFNPNFKHIGYNGFSSMPSLEALCKLVALNYVLK